MSIGNVTENILEMLGRKYTLREQSAGEFALLKVKGMQFSIKRYLAEGLGNVSVMQAKGFCGLMKMDTLMINPTEVDLPLLSYDRILAMGNDTLIIELYDTLLEKGELTSLQQVKDKYADLPEHDLGAHWYDSIKLAESVSKKGKKAQSVSFNSLSEEYLAAYLASASGTTISEKTDTGIATAAGNTLDIREAETKKQKASVYVEGLLKNGGPSTDIFKKELGEEKTAYLFRKILFGTGDLRA